MDFINLQNLITYMKPSVYWIIIIIIIIIITEVTEKFLCDGIYDVS